MRVCMLSGPALKKNGIYRKLKQMCISSQLFLYVCSIKKEIPTDYKPSKKQVQVQQVHLVQHFWPQVPSCTVVAFLHPHWSLSPVARSRSLSTVRHTKTHNKYRIKTVFRHQTPLIYKSEAGLVYLWGRKWCAHSLTPSRNTLVQTEKKGKKIKESKHCSLSGNTSSVTLATDMETWPHKTHR